MINRQGITIDASINGLDRSVIQSTILNNTCFISMYILHEIYIYTHTHTREN